MRKTRVFSFFQQMLTVQQIRDVCANPKGYKGTSSELSARQHRKNMLLSWEDNQVRGFLMEKQVERILSKKILGNAWGNILDCVESCLVRTFRKKRFQKWISFHILFIKVFIFSTMGGLCSLLDSRVSSTSTHIEVVCCWG